MKVQPKKHLGQHFLKNEGIAQDIAQSLIRKTPYTKVLEIGAGMGVLTKYLLEDARFETWVVEIDSESISYLQAHYLTLSARLLEQDFLWMDLAKFSKDPFAIIGNFPYNISSQILFKALAMRIAGDPGSKEYGILSVLLQAYYDIEYLFTVGENEFIPPPKVKSGVIRLIRNNTVNLPCDEVKFKLVVKTGFNQRRKTLRNALQSLVNDKLILSNEIYTKRAEQLSVADFIWITNQLFPAV